MESSPHPRDIPRRELFLEPLRERDLDREALRLGDLRLGDLRLGDLRLWDRRGMDVR